MYSPFIALAAFIKPYMLQISLILVTCSLVVLDSYIHHKIKRMIRGLAFIFRVAVYVLMFTFVYGLLITYLSPLLARWLYSLSEGLLLLSLLFSFVLLGVLIERK